MIKQSKGITLIALVITIIILLILAGVSISTLGGENGLFARAKQAKEETQISNYKEQIELIKANLQIQNEDYKSPTIAQLKEEFDTNHKKWVSSTEIITDNGKEKLKLTTKEGYIFYITESTTEYKGKGKVIDTSALQRDDVIKLEITQETESGKLVQITNLSSQNYYKIKYQINSTEGEWQDIKSGNEVEVPYGGTIYAKLIYGSNSGIVHRLSVENSEPKVVAKEIDLSNLTRKTEISIADLFEITWGSDGKESTEYTVTGNLNFNNTSFSSTKINNISNLEIGTYKVTCKAISSSNQTATAEKEVKVTALANTSVTNESNINLEAKAIYSEYDLAYFRDLVNAGQTAINGKVMNDIDLTNVCSAKIGNWTPIGVYDSSKGIASFDLLQIYYDGVFDGNDNTIHNIYINNSNLYRQGLFSALNNNGIIKNVSVDGNIIAYQNIGGIVAWNNGNVFNCISNMNLSGTNTIGGIVGYNAATIKNIKNTSIVVGNGEKIGGIVGWNMSTGTILEATNSGDISTGKNIGGISGINEGNIKNSSNSGNINSEKYYIGGICGYNKSNLIENCHNVGSIATTGYYTDDANINNSYIGGIAGYNESTISKCYNSNNENNMITGEYGSVGGICGANLGMVKECYNTDVVIGRNAERIGGIVGRNNGGTIANCYNRNAVSGYNTTRNIGGICGANLGKVYNVYSLTDVFSEKGYRVGEICGNMNADTAELKYGYVTNEEAGILSANGESASSIIGQSPNYVGYIIGVIMKGTYSNCERNIPSYTVLNSNSNALGYGENVWKQDSGKNNGYPILSWQ